MDTGLHKTGNAVFQACIARLIKLLQGSAAFLCQAVLKAMEDADVLGVPALETTTQHEEESVCCGEEPEIGPQVVIAMLAVAHRGDFIKIYLAPASSDQEVGEPIVVDDLASTLDSHEEGAGGMVKDHCITTGDVLCEGVLKTRRLGIIRGEIDGFVVGVDHAGAAAIETRDFGRDGPQEGDGSLKFIAFPDVILIGVGVEIGLNICMGDQGEEVGDKTLLRAAMNRQALFPPHGLIF